MQNNNSGQTRYPWWKVHPILTGCLAALVITAITVAAIVLPSKIWPPRVYVTDGSASLGNGGNLSDVEAAVKKEDDWVSGEHKPFVSIGVLLTMSPDPGVEPLNDARVRHALEGAYIAQREHNHPSGPTGLPGAPLVKLLLADEGSQQHSWQKAASALEKKVNTSDHLVAVTGLGISVASTNKVIAELGSHQIGMVGAVTTGDNLSNLDDFFRVAPNNSGEAAAAAAFLKSDPDPNNPQGKNVKIWMVEDQNRTDNYGSSLAAGFTHALNTPASGSSHSYQIVQPGTTYNSQLPDAATVLSTVGDHTCDSGANIVYFAGRGSDLQGFLSGLGKRYCAASKPLTVLTGSDATELVNSQGALWPQGTNISVYYTALAHPDMWSKAPDAAAPGIVSSFQDKTDGFFAAFPKEPAKPLDDGWAIMYHDAVLTAETAAANGFLKNNLPSAGDVAQLLYQVRVKGLSGYICLDGAHDPRNKAIPIVQIDAHGAVSYVALSSSSGGRPTNAKCQ